MKNLIDVSMLAKHHRLVLRGFQSRIRSLEALKDLSILELYLDHYLPLPPLGLNEKVLCFDTLFRDPPLKFYH